MSLYNLILVADEKQEHILMCLRAKEPFRGKYNLVGGKAEAEETGLESAYRELEEETGITQRQIRLQLLTVFESLPDHRMVEVYFGILTEAVVLQEEMNPLRWFPLQGTDFHDTDVFAGNGNLGDFIEMIRTKNPI